ncbi:hypothetical protein QJS10_CPB17g01116 [Acorus calamus]|uniref:Uncharacterized protein n=1 Tax=Acorus calamus TaxID=4465 RepID=A0AAV9CWR9_ACOCL|nr:hypothetical protein QJS10_CPB17g01116 [Acorus calamus]
MPPSGGKLEMRARSCYADKIEMEREDFVKMLILDGCFIIGLFLCMSEELGTVSEEENLRVWKSAYDEDRAFI